MKVPLEKGESLTLLRIAGWRCAVPMSGVIRILSAAMPLATPSQEAEGLLLHVRIGSELLPVVYGATLFGEGEALLRAEDKMIVLRGSGRKCVLWVDIVEDMFPYVPLQNAPDTQVAGSEWMLAVTGGELSVPVLNLEHLVAAAHAN